MFFFSHSYDSLVIQSVFKGGFLLLLLILLTPFWSDCPDDGHVLYRCHIYLTLIHGVSKRCHGFSRCFPGFKLQSESVNQFSPDLLPTSSWSDQPKGKTTGETEATDSEEAAPSVVLSKILGETWYCKCWGFCRLIKCIREN